MQIRSSKNDFELHQSGGMVSPGSQGYPSYQNAAYPPQSGYGYGGSSNQYSSNATTANGYGQFGGQNQQQQSSSEQFSGKSFLSGNTASKSPYPQSSQKTQSLGLNSYSTSTSNLSTKRDYLSLQNRPQSPQQPGQSGLLSNQFQSQQQLQGTQPFRNNFFQSNNHQQEGQQSQQLFQGGYSITAQNKQQGSQQEQQQLQLQSQQQRQQAQASFEQQQQYLKRGGQTGQSLSLQHYQQQQQQQQQVQSGIGNKNQFDYEPRHTSVDQLKNKENLQNTLSKIYNNQPAVNKIANTPLSSNSSSSAALVSNFQSAMQQPLSQQISARPTQKEGYTPIMQSAERQQLRSSTTHNQIDSRFTSNGQGSASSVNLKENTSLNGNNTYASSNTLFQQDYSQQQQQGGSMSYQRQYEYGVNKSNSPMYHSGIVQTNSQLANHAMKRSEVIETKSNNYLNQADKIKYSNSPSSINQSNQGTQAEKNYTLFPSNSMTSTKLKPTSADPRAHRQKNASQGESDSAEISEIKQKQDIQRVSSATPVSSTTKRSQQFEYKSSSRLNDSSTQKNADSFEGTGNRNGTLSSPVTGSRQPQLGTSQSQYIKPRTDVAERKEAQSTIFPQSSSTTTGIKLSANTGERKSNQISNEPRVYSEEYQEYKKLQEKLSYLESKIMSIKTNIDSTYQKERDEQRKESISTTASKVNTSTTSTSKQSAITAQSSSNARPLSSQPYKSNANQTNQPNPYMQQAQNYSSSRPSANQISQETSNRSSPKDSITNKPSTSSSTPTGQKVTQQLNSELWNNSNTKNKSNISLNKNITSPSSQQQTQSPAQQESSDNNPLSSFVTQVSKGSGIPLSPKTATNLTKKHKLEEKVSATVHYDPNSPSIQLSPHIPKSYLQNQQASSSKGTQDSANKSNNSSYIGKRREDSDSIDISSTNIQSQGPYYPSSAKNSTTQGKSSIILSKNSQTTQSVQSLKNSNIISKTMTNNNINNNLQNKSPPPLPPYIYYISPIIKAYMEPHNTSVFATLAREHLIQTMQAIGFAKALKPATIKVINEKKVFLPTRKDNKKTLVFDLDETLIHCNENSNIPSDVVLPIKFPTGEIIEAGINVRPYCLEILQELSKYYELVIFTASHSCYANVVLDYLDPKNQYISGRLFREHCVTTDEGVYIKDLRVISNRNLSDMVLVDNAAYSFGFQLDNGIPIIPFYDNKNDAELKHLANFMKQISQVRDLREVVRKFLKVGSFTDYSDPITLLQTLFEDLIY